MSFELPKYHAPDFEDAGFKAMPDVKTVAVVKEGVAPEHYHAMRIYTEYFKIDGRWVLPNESRMDCVAVVRDPETVEVVEFRNLKVGDQVVVGRKEDGSEGIYMYNTGFLPEEGESDVFAFRSGRSRETAYSKDYDELYDLLRYEKENGGHVVWVLGHAVSFDHDARKAVGGLIE